MPSLAHTCICLAYRSLLSRLSYLIKPRRYLSDFECKLSANSVRNSLEANSEFRCKCITNLSVVTQRVHHRQGYRQQRGKHPFYSAPSSTEIICAAHKLSRQETIGRHLRASNEMIHGDFGIMILILRL